MKRFLRWLPVSPPILALLCLLQPNLAADTPPAPLPLHDRVRISTHIFVGTVKNVNFIDERGNIITPKQAYERCFTHAKQYQRYHEATPQSIWKSPEPLVEIELSNKETLLSTKVRLNSAVKLRLRVHIALYLRQQCKPKDMERFLSSSRKDIGQVGIYLTTIVPQEGAKAYFVSCDGPYYREELKMKSKIQSLTKQQKTKGK